MRLTFVIAAAILFGLAAYAKLLAMGQAPRDGSYAPLQNSRAVHVAHADE